MTYNPLLIRGISFINSTNTSPAQLELQDGLNVICGASDTGKSFIVEAIDFLLGAGGPLRDIPELVPYDRGRLVLQEEGEEPFTIERSRSGGGFRKFEGFWLSGVPDSSGVVLRDRHSPGREDTLSANLLSSLGLSDKSVRKNRQGETRSLSFRDLARLVVVQEEEITKRSSPFLTGQYTQKTVECSVFKLLLTGTDDSALVGQVETVVTQQNSRAKVELIDELLNDWNDEVSELGVSRSEAEERLNQLEQQSIQQQEVLNRVQYELNSRIEERGEVARTLSSISSRINEINALLARFELLNEHYQVDLERLSAIEESGSLFVHLERTPCPLCGALPEERHQGDDCDGDIPSVVNAATAEVAKIQKLIVELNETIIDLREESRSLVTRRDETSNQLQSLSNEIQESVAPAFSESQSVLNEMLVQANSMRQVVDLYIKIQQLEEKKLALLEENQEPTDSSTISPPIPSASVLDSFAVKVQQILKAWDFPGADRVHFDTETADIVINGQPRGSRGKGLRAITHAAMTLGLLDFCKERDLPHPGFVVLDSPLLAYWAPESAEDSLQGTDLKDRFYNYLANNYRGSQVIIVENEHPPHDIEDRINLFVFTKNPNEGRYGFVPL